MSEFFEALSRSSLRKDPERAVYYLTTGWNRAAEAVTCWPKQRLQVPRRRTLISPSMGELPSTFRQSLEAYINWLQRSDLLADDTAPPLAPATLQHRQLQIRRFFGELILDGIMSEELPDLESMIRPAIVYRGLTAMLRRKGGASGMIHGMAYTLLVIATHYVRLADNDLEKLRSYCRRLKPNHRGMTSKNKKRLQQFDDRSQMNRLLLLPEVLVAEAGAGALSSKRRALLVETALAIELLTMTALRIKNLTTLRLDDNFLWSRSPWKGVCHLEIPAREMKNGQPFERELGDQTLRLLKLYVEVHRPHIVPVQSRWLFSRRDGTGPVDRSVFGNRLSKIILLKTGLTFNAHLARHLSGKLYLDRFPGGYEDVRLQLGHKNLTTTTSFYTGQEDKAAAKRFDELIYELRAKARGRDGRRASGMRAS